VVLVFLLPGGRIICGSQKWTTYTLLKLKEYLGEYKSLTGSYPPDGLDSRLKTKDGAEITGSACLHYILTNPVKVPDNVGGKSTPREVSLDAKFLERELSPEDPALPGVREIVDGWGIPIHYDNTEDGVFKPQRGEVHLPPIPDDKHPPDPREGPLAPGGPVQKLGIQGKGFDLWSHGEQWCEWEEPVKPSIQKPIASWSLEE
jgi:hypothetical protein